MLTPSGYGQSSYYWTGISGNFQKLLNLPNGQVTAGWLSGLVGGPPNPSSNLGPRVVSLYSNPSNQSRFGAIPLFPTSVNFVGLWGMNRAVFPHSNANWRVFPPIFQAIT